MDSNKQINSSTAIGVNDRIPTVLNSWYSNGGKSGASHTTLPSLFLQLHGLSKAGFPSPVRTQGCWSTLPACPWATIFPDRSFQTHPRTAIFCSYSHGQGNCLPCPPNPIPLEANSDFSTSWNVLCTGLPIMSTSSKETWLFLQSCG